MARSPKTAERKRQNKIKNSPAGGAAYRGTITSRVDELPRPWQLTPKHGPESDTSDDRNNPIYQEAEERFQYCEGWEMDSRRLWLEDLKFAEADPDNGFQWPNHMRRNRDVDRRPALTVNKARIHCLQIINDCKQNKPGISIRPTSDGASFKSAQIFEDIVRDVERRSNATIAYDIAVEFQVKCGLGYWKIEATYEDNDSFNQYPMIRSVNQPLSIYMDPDIKERDGSDARYAFDFTDWDKELYKKKYPKYANNGSLDVLGSGDNWLDRHHVRVCTYWRKQEKKDKLILLPNDVRSPQGSIQGGVVERESRIRALFKDDPETFKQLMSMPDVRKRRIITDEVEWYKIVGHDIVDEGIWAGKYIPIVRLIGEETIIDGRLDRKGHVRNLKDPQRIYNYWTSAAVEHIALQGKTPWIASMESIEGYETYWSTANIVNHNYLPFNAIDDDGNKLEAPKRAEMPQFSDAYIKGMQVAGNEMMYASGQYQSQMGENENAKSGVAIGERQRQGDNATFHFPDNLDVAIRFTGVILVDLIPKLYDVKRVMMLEGADGKQHQVTIDPGHREASSIEDNTRTLEAIKSIFNPAVGKYSVYADKGPNFATKRQEAFDAFTKLLTSWKEGIQVVGDLYFLSADFPHADEAAERIKRMIPAHILGQGPTPAETQLQQEVQKLQGMLQDLMQKNHTLSSKTHETAAKRNIGEYDAVTKRIDVLAKMMINPSDAHSLWADLIREEHRASLQPAEKAIGEDIGDNDDNGQAAGAGGEEQPPVLGARKSPKDGQWYVPDSARQGKFLRVNANA